MKTVYEDYLNINLSEEELSLVKDDLQEVLYRHVVEDMIIPKGGIPDNYKHEFTITKGDEPKLSVRFELK
jgi:hypothetical protein